MMKKADLLATTVTPPDIRPTTLYARNSPTVQNYAAALETMAALRELDRACDHYTVNLELAFPEGEPPPWSLERLVTARLAIAMAERESGNRPQHMEMSERTWGGLEALFFNDDAYLVKGATAKAVTSFMGLQIIQRETFPHNYVELVFPDGRRQPIFL